MSMSKITLDRLPKHVKHMFRIYEGACSSLDPLKAKKLRKYARESSADYENFQRFKLLNEKSLTNKLDKHAFPPIILSNIANLFEEPLNIGKLEGIPTRDLLKLEKIKSSLYKRVPFETDPIPSETHKTKHYTDYQAHVLNSLASYFKWNRSLPPTKQARNSFLWYLRLLRQTPVILFLKEDNRLFSETSLSEVNKPLQDFQHDLSRLRATYKGHEEKSTRNYHMTDLVSLDLFDLAIRSQYVFQDEGLFEHNVNNFNWDALDLVQDKLTHFLSCDRSITITDSEFVPVSVDAESLMAKYPFREVIKQAESFPVREVFPYDLKYVDYYILTIENPILNEDHLGLFKLLQSFKDHFHLAAVRIHMRNEYTNKFFHSVAANQFSSAFDSGTYNDLLQLAKTRHNSDVVENTPLGRLVKLLGEQGLVRVEESPDKSALYLFST